MDDKIPTAAEPNGGSPRPEPSPPPADELLLFGRYRVERELGRGGMGVVVLARDEKLGQPVAIKLLPDEVVKDSEAIRDLRREVLRGMELTHPGIVRTHYFEQDDSGAGIVMEYVDGSTLAQLKVPESNDCFDCAHILPWIQQLCAVLDYAHTDAKIAHRDLKPRNVMLTLAGRLKVADFGISSSISDSLTRISLRHNSSGTPPYMSPQQLSGARPSGLDDIYSLGAMIYELLTGKPPFFRNLASIAAQAWNVVPPPMAERREDLGVHDKQPIPAAWEATVAACLAKEREDRPQSAGEVLRRLLAPEPAQESEPVVTVGRALIEPLLVEKKTRKRVGAGRIAAYTLPVISVGGIALFFALPEKPNDVPQAGKPLAGAQATPVPQVPGPVENPLLLATRDRPYVNSLGMKFVPVPGAKVLVCIQQTRQQDYAAYALANPSAGSGAWKSPLYRGTESVGNEPTMPVVMINWRDAAAFCQWLSVQDEKATQQPISYRLPTRDEFRAAWGSGAYPWGSQWPPPKAGGNYADDTARAKFGNTFPAIAGYDDGFATLAPAGSFPSNASGLHDIGSNIQEWCDDPPAAGTSRRLVLGASWLSADKDILSWKSDAAHEFALPEDSSSPFVGFRCVISLPGN